MRLRLMHDCAAGNAGAIVELQTTEARKLVNAGYAYETSDLARERQIEGQGKKKPEPEPETKPKGRGRRPETADATPEGETADEIRKGGRS